MTKALLFRWVRGILRIPSQRQGFGGLFFSLCFGLCFGIACCPLAARSEGRSEWVLAQIQQRNAHLSPQLRQEKFGMMGATLYDFFRATNHLFWTDYGNSPQLSSFGSPTTRIWIQGDAHCGNVSALLANENRVIFELDDFDDALIADYQLDVWRMAISMLLAVQENGGLPQREQEQLIDTFTLSYLRTLHGYIDNANELVTTFSIENTPGFLSDWMSREAEQTHYRVLRKNTVLASGKRAFNFDKPGMLPVSNAQLHALQAAMTSYQATLTGRLAHIPSYFRIKSVALKAKGGMGSLGSLRFFVLIEGLSASQDDDRILDLKSEGAPAGWQWMDPSVRDSLVGMIGNDHALRVVLGYRAMGYRSDEHLGSLHALGEHFFVRERTPVRSSIEMSNIVNPQRARLLAKQWGAILATSHARADQDSSPLLPYDFEKEVFAKVASEKQRLAFVTRVRQIAFFYARQVNDDYRAFKEWQAKVSKVAQTQ